MSELLPCPFCGARAAYGDVEFGESRGGWFVTCTSKECQASTNLVYPLKDDVRAVLAEKWNRRSPPAPAIDVEGVERLRCGVLDLSADLSAVREENERHGSALERLLASCEDVFLHDETTSDIRDEFANAIKQARAALGGKEPK